MNQETTIDGEISCINCKQAAEYGLSLLEEFKKLQSRNYELENELETCKSELEIANQAFAKVKQIKKEENAKGLHNEENLLIESANREEILIERINNLELELNKLKQEIVRLESENNKLQIINNDLTQQCEYDKDLQAKQRIEIKELKLRENRLLNENTELEDDNVQLQQQLVKLRQNLIEFDTIKHENKALQETVSHSLIL